MAIPCSPAAISWDARHRHVLRHDDRRPAVGKVDPRYLIFIGLTLATVSLYVMVGWSLDVSARAIAIDSVTQGVGLGFVFVPLNTIAFATLPGELRTEGAALWTLIRNIGSSVGISIVIAELTNMIYDLPRHLVEHVTPFNDGLSLPDARDSGGHDVSAASPLSTGSSRSRRRSSPIPTTFC